MVAKEMKERTEKWPEVGPHLLHDACLRCCREFKSGEMCRAVWGGPSARYRDIGLIVCRNCFLGEQLDRIEASTLYVRGDGAGDRAGNRALNWPVYYGSYGVQGFAKMSRLSNGVYRVGLHRGHVEVWSNEEVETLGRVIKSQAGTMGYSINYEFYGPMNLGLIAHAEEEIEFVDLSKPKPLLMMPPPLGIWLPKRSSYVS